MISFLLKRLALIFPTLIGITVLTFALIHLIPGDPVETMSGERGMDPGRHARLLHEFGLDRPLYVQYGDYLGHLARGDLGMSLTTQQPVLDEFMSLFPATVELSLCALSLGLLIGLAVGIISALNRGRFIDYLLMSASLIGYSIPIFWWGLLLILFFSVQLGWTPVSGRISVEFDIPARTGLMLIDTLRSAQPGSFSSALSHLLLPSIALGTIPLAVIARMTRSAMLEVLGEDYVRAARARGVSRGQVIMVHALRNALIPITTILGLQAGLLLSGAILTETIFSWPGVGNWLIHAVLSRDYPVVQGGILLIAILVIVINLVVDLLYGVINPRIRHA